MAVLEFYVDGSMKENAFPKQNKRTHLGFPFVFDVYGKQILSGGLIMGNPTLTSGDVEAHAILVAIEIARTYAQGDEVNVDSAIIYTDAQFIIDAVYGKVCSSIKGVETIKEELSELYYLTGVVAKLIYCPGHASDTRKIPEAMRAVDVLSRRVGRDFPNSRNRQSFIEVVTEIFVRCWRRGFACERISLGFFYENAPFYILPRESIKKKYLNELNAIKPAKLF